MSKSVTTVYLTASQRGELVRLSALHGRAMADLIREGVDHVIGDLGGTVEREEAESRRTVSRTLSERVAQLERDVRDLRLPSGPSGAHVAPRRARIGAEGSD